MNPYEIIRASSTNELKRLFTSPFLHADNYHLYYNISSLLYKGSYLENRIGSKSFLVMSVFLIVVSGVYSLCVLNSV